MKLKDIVVIHKIFGEGIIAEVVRKGENTYILVNFIREVKEFAFPGIFETEYMRFKDEHIQAKFNEEFGVKKCALKGGREVSENSNDKYIEKYKKIRQLRVFATRAAYYIGPLLLADLFTYYGAAAQKIYLACCDTFGWKSNLNNNFGRQQKLFAERATPEGYDVWFISNNNFTSTNTDNFTNKISDDLKNIYELWTNNAINMDGGSHRVVFAKTSNAKYVFLGVYVVKKILRVDNGSRLKIYERVSETYPANK